MSRATRSSARLAAAPAAPSAPAASVSTAATAPSRPSPARRPAKSLSSAAAAPSPKKRKLSPPTATTATSLLPRPPPASAPRVHTHLPPRLTFDLATATAHLAAHDARFAHLFAAIPCRPFVPPYRPVDPFRTLVTSIIGQQVSWLAARAINGRFRAFFGHSAASTDEDGGFPEPAEVARAEVAALKAVGLSTRKAEYVIALAQHFVEGQLSTELFRDGTDDDVARALIAVRGIGQWTVDMFLIFSLRRPDVLPVGDLGVQKGLLRWALAAHGALPPARPKTPGKTPKRAKTVPAVAAAERATTPTPDAVPTVSLAAGVELDTVKVSPPSTPARATLHAASAPAAPAPPAPATPRAAGAAKPAAPPTPLAAFATPGRLPGTGFAPPGTPATPLSATPTASGATFVDGESQGRSGTPSAPAPAAMSVPAETLQVDVGGGADDKALPPPAPDAYLAPGAGCDAHAVAPLTDGLSVAVLRERLGGKKAKGGMYLTPREMEVLTDGWRPYRSLGVIYTWAVAEEV